MQLVQFRVNNLIQIYDIKYHLAVAWFPNCPSALIKGGTKRCCPLNVNVQLNISQTSETSFRLPGNNVKTGEIGISKVDKSNWPMFVLGQLLYCYRRLQQRLLIITRIENVCTENVFCPPLSVQHVLLTQNPVLLSWCRICSSGRFGIHKMSFGNTGTTSVILFCSVLLSNNILHSAATLNRFSPAWMCFQVVASSSSSWGGAL